LKRFYSNTLPLLLDIDSRHAIKALRCKENDVIEVIDGKGKLFEATIFSIQRNEIQLIDLKLILEEKENKQVLSIAIAPTKNPARLEWFVEKATEIGIKHIYPIISKRSEKINVKMDRLQNIIVAATKQSKQLHLPTLHQIVALETFVQDKKLPTQKYIAHCEAMNKKNLNQVYQKNEEVLVLIGPEGDFTMEEIDLCQKENFVPIHLGNSTLRTETAGIYACALLRNLNEL
jgi:16S rRNA (uracil1498-N3)-methyltransferase